MRIRVSSHSWSSKFKGFSLDEASNHQPVPLMSTAHQQVLPELLLNLFLAPVDVVNAYAQQLGRGDSTQPLTHERAYSHALNTWNTRFYGTSLQACDAVQSALKQARESAVVSKPALTFAEEVFAGQVERLRQRARRTVRLAFAY